MFVQAAGWAGAGLILLGYTLVSTGRLVARSVRFQAINVLGAFGLVLSGTAQAAWPSVALNVAWVAIGLFALWRLGVARGDGG